MQPVRFHQRFRLAPLETLEPRVLLTISTLFSPTDTPPEWVDPQAVEMGVKFRASVSGYILGIRFYKGPDNLGTHLGHLWDGNGTLMGAVTFNSESATGWQEADFASPIPILANHTYIASYFAPLGRYSFTYQYFTGASHSSSDGRLTALASGTDGPNSVFIYAPQGGFPNNTFRDLNYWVDVAFANNPPTDIALSNNTVAEHLPASTAVGTFSTVDADAVDSFTYSLVSGVGAIDNLAFTINGDTLETAAPFDFNTKISYSIRVRSTDDDGLFTEKTFAIDVTQTPLNAVVNRQLFYFNSTAFDVSGHDNAIATDKVALLPGETASLANYSSYDRGLNGIMIDVSGAILSLVPGDFAFHVGNDNAPDAWILAPDPSNIIIRPAAGVGGSMRIELTWPDNVIQNQWLQVTMHANANTGISADDVFYFGNAIGESGNSGADAKVTAVDEIATHANPGVALITNPWDFNRDGIVDSSDQSIAHSHVTNFLNALNLIAPPGPPAPAFALSQAIAAIKLPSPVIVAPVSPSIDVTLPANRPAGTIAHKVKRRHAIEQRDLLADGHAPRSLQRRLLFGKLPRLM